MLLALHNNALLIRDIWDEEKVVSGPRWSEKGSRYDETYDDIEFALIGDTHYGEEAEKATAYTYAYHLGVVNSLNSLKGTAYPGTIPGNVGDIAFVINPGDAIDDGNDYPTSIDTHLDHWGFDGTDGKINFPMYYVRGNHDNATDWAYKYIKGRYGDYCYRMEYNGVHFIFMDSFAQSSETLGDRSEVYIDSNCPMSWVKEQLAAIGKKDRIVLVQHYDFRTDGGFKTIPGQTYSWWSTTDGDELAAAIADYNVIAILHGHYHTICSPDDVELYTEFDGYSVFGTNLYYPRIIKITDTKLYVATWNQRNDAFDPVPGGNHYEVDLTSQTSYSEKSVPDDDGDYTEKGE
jgi:hypothetical protein